MAELKGDSRAKSFKELAQEKRNREMQMMAYRETVAFLKLQHDELVYRIGIYELGKKYEGIMEVEKKKLEAIKKEKEDV